jgi:hypothetical protein
MDTFFPSIVSSTSAGLAAVEAKDLVAAVRVVAAAALAADRLSCVRSIVRRAEKYDKSNVEGVQLRKETKTRRTMKLQS